MTAQQKKQDAQEALETAARYLRDAIRDLSDCEADCPEVRAGYAMQFARTAASELNLAIAAVKHA